MPKIQYNKGRYSITVPKELMDGLKLKKGDVLRPQINSQGNIEYIRLKDKSKGVGRE